MIKILAIIDKFGSRYHRIKLPLEKIMSEDIKIDFLETKELKEDMIKGYNVLWVERLAPVDSMTLSIWLDKYSVKYIIDLDDAVEVGKHINKEVYDLQKTVVQRQLVLADLVILSSLELVDYVSKFNHSIAFIPNFIPFEEGQFKWEGERNNKKMVVGLLGSISHYYDYMTLRNPLKRIFSDREIQEKCKFVLVADKKNDLWKKVINMFTHKNIELEVLEPKSVTEYMSLYDDMDVVLAPLENTEFNRCKCIVGDSLVVTENGLEKIKDLVDNKSKAKVMIDGEQKSIINHFVYKNVPTLKITTVDGYCIEGTPHHKIFINGDFIELSKLRVGDNIEITTSKINHNNYQKICYPLLLTKAVDSDLFINSVEANLPTITITEDWGRLIGYMLGDGHFHTAGLAISCDKRHTEVVNDVTKLMYSIGVRPKFIHKTPDKRCINSLIKEGNGLDIKAYSLHFRKIAEKYNWCGKNGKTFRVPEQILKSPLSVIKEFLKGLFEADGTIGNTVSFLTKDKIFAEQLQTLLLNFNIRCKIKHVYNKHYRKYYYDLSLRREGSEIFAKEIGFISAHKKEKIAQMQLRRISNNSYKHDWTDKIMSIEETINDVYDIEVEDKHCYIANGIKNHNSSLKILEAATREIPVIGSHLYLEKGFNCFIPVKHSGDWYKAIKSFLKNRDYRILGKEIKQFLMEKYPYDVAVNKRKELLYFVINKKEENLDDVNIYSIVYNDEQVAAFKRYDNSHIRTIEQKSYLYEYNAILDINSKLQDLNGYTGVFSYKFGAKTGIYPKMLWKILKGKNYQNYDFINLSPQYWKTGREYLEFSEKEHPGLLERLKELCNVVNLPYVENPNVINFSNFYIMKTEVFNDYVNNYITPAIEYMENHRDRFFIDAQYKGGLPAEELEKYTGLSYYPILSFVLERLILMYLEDKNLKVLNVL